MRHDSITSTDLHNALTFLSRVYVGRQDEERLMRTLNALRREYERQTEGSAACQ